MSDVNSAEIISPWPYLDSKFKVKLMKKLRFVCLMRTPKHTMQCIREVTIQFEEACRGHYFHVLTSNFGISDMLLPYDYEI